jgi:carbonic anhydrase/acetyltransferase-like protein (isoleucine patch superfamily)
MNNLKKYKLNLNAPVILNGVKLFHIIALKDFGTVKKGEWGGLVQSEDNLSHDGDCWIHSGAKVYGKAYISCDAQIYDSAEIFDTAHVSEKAIVCSKTKVYGDSHISGNSYISGCSQVYGQALVYGDAIVNGYAEVFGAARVHDVEVSCDEKVFENSYAQLA